MLKPFYLYLLIFLLVLSLLMVALGLELIEGFSVSVFIGIVIIFIHDLGNEISVRHIIAFICTLQWLLGPVLGYVYKDYVYQDYQMAVPKSVYFGFVLPSTLLFLAGLYLKLGKKIVPNIIYPFIDYYSKGVLLVILGFLFEPFNLGFAGYLLTGIRFVGIFYIYISGSKYRFFWISLVFGYLFFISLGAAMFHDLLLWGSFFLMIIFITNKKSLTVRISYLISGILIIFMLQLIKKDYREYVWYEQSEPESRLEVFANIATNKIFSGEPIFTKQNISNTIVRINQGWIIAKIMDYVPSVQPYVHGETIKDAVIASIFPRFLYKNKAQSGGQENMLRFTGINIFGIASMDISQVGEAWANFGYSGGILFMLILGLFFNWVLFRLEKLFTKYPDLIFWFPLIFLQVIKAESSLVTILNHLVKALIVTWIFFTPYAQKIFNFPIRRRGPK
jgi:hypothetical protein